MVLEIKSEDEKIFIRNLLADKIMKCIHEIESAYQDFGPGAEFERWRLTHAFVYAELAMARDMINRGFGV